MGLQSFHPNLYLMEYVPQRLAAVEVCVHACYAALKRNSDEPTPASFDLNCSSLQFADQSVCVLDLKIYQRRAHLDTDFARQLP
jgi:hypothetical protein